MIKLYELSRASLILVAILAMPYTSSAQLGSTNSGSPSVMGVTPSSGGGLSQIFSFQYTDASGSSSIYQVEQILNAAASYAGGCATTFVQTQNAVYLMNDAGSAWLGPATLGSSGTLQNSQCSINAGQSSASASGNTLILNLALSFNSGFGG